MESLKTTEKVFKELSKLPYERYLEEVVKLRVEDDKELDADYYPSI